MSNNMLYFFISLLLISTSCKSNKTSDNPAQQTDTIEIKKEIIVGAERTSEYLPLLRNKKVALLVNHTSLVKNTHLVDTLWTLGIKLQKIFAPEHGFRGNEERGILYKDGFDSKTGLPIISLIGKNKKPLASDLANVDVLIYDLQDVGVRFYTYISSMYLLMQACADNNKKLIILDRPNPNGDYVAGPILDTVNFRSFVGMLPIPVVYGMTAGELAQMINGENWLNGNKKCDLTIIKNENYTHSSHYSLPVKPSPNLPNDISIRLYPSLCFFEATMFSVGRGTDFPFQVVGYPDDRFGYFTFTPRDIAGVQTNPIQEGNTCYGIDLRKEDLSHKFTLKYILDYYKLCDNDIKLITRSRWFDLLMGTDKVRKQIIAGKTESEIKNSWQNELDIFKKKREKYLLYE